MRFMMDDSDHLDVSPTVGYRILKTALGGTADPNRKRKKRKREKGCVSDAVDLIPIKMRCGTEWRITTFTL